MLQSRLEIATEIKQLITSLFDKDLADHQETTIHQLQDFINDVLMTLNQLKSLYKILFANEADSTFTEKKLTSAKKEIDKVKALEQSNTKVHLLNSQSHLRP